MKSSYLFLLLPLFFVTLCSSSPNTPSRARSVGGWTPIKDLTDPHIIQVANFAISEYNRDANSITKLKLSKVVSGETQVVEGINYKLVIQATDERNYEAVVWEKPGEKFMKLTSFKNLFQ